MTVYNERQEPFFQWIFVVFRWKRLQFYSFRVDNWWAVPRGFVCVDENFLLIFLWLSFRWGLGWRFKITTDRIIDSSHRNIFGVRITFWWCVCYWKSTRMLQIHNYIIDSLRFMASNFIQFSFQPLRRSLCKIIKRLKRHRFTCYLFWTKIVEIIWKM